MIKKVIILASLILGVFITVYAQEEAFEVRHNGVLLTDGSEIEIDKYNVDPIMGNIYMKFEAYVTNISDGSRRMKLIKNEEELMLNTSNTMCWDLCMSPADPEAYCDEILSGETDYTYGEIILNFGGREPVVGTSIISYTFKTTKKGDPSLTVRVKYTYKEKEKPTVSENDSQLLLSGEWAADDFSSLDASSPLLTGLDMSNITIPADAPALNTTNPNILIYTAADATVPVVWENVIKGSVSESINLKDGYPFLNTKEFTASSISYTRNYICAGWASGCLPFAVSSMPEGIKAEYFSDSKGTEVQFTGVSALEANTPYIFNIASEGEKIFAATDVLIPITTLTKVEKGEYTFEGTFSKIKEGEATGLYMMHHDGTGFRRATDTNDILAFRSFIKYTGTDQIPQLSISHKDGETVIENETTGKNTSLIIYSSGNVVEIIATKAQQLYIYSLDGRRIRTLNLSAGLNTINELVQGLYIMDNQKVVIR